MNNLVCHFILAVIICFHSSALYASSQVTFLDPSLANYFQSTFRVNLKQFYPQNPPANYDYTEAFRNGLRKVFDHGGGVLEVDPGRYRVCSEVYLKPEIKPTFRADSISTVAMRGTGGKMESTEIYCPTSMPAGTRGFFVFEGKSETINGIRHDIQYGVSLENFSIEGDPGRWAWTNIAGIVSLYRDHFHMKNVMVTNVQVGVKVVDGQPHIEDSKFRVIGSYGVDVSQAGDGYVMKCEFAQIGCDLRSSGLCSAKWQKSAAIYAGGDQVISGHVIGSSSGSGVRVSELRGGELNIVNNQFDYCSKVLEFDEKVTPDDKGELHVSTNVLFAGNKVQGCAGLERIPGYSTSMRIIPQVHYISGDHLAAIKIVDNMFSGLAAGGEGFKIRYADDIQIRGNSFSQYYTFTRQPILGNLINLNTVVKLNITDNAFHSDAQNQFAAIFTNVRGFFKDNIVSGKSSGINKNSSPQLRCSNNIGWRKTSAANPVELDDAKDFLDASGCITFPTF